MVRCTIKTTSRSNILSTRIQGTLEIILNTLLKKTAIATVLATSVLSLSACYYEVSVSKNGAVVNANATATAALK